MKHAIAATAVIMLAVGFFLGIMVKRNPAPANKGSGFENDPAEAFTDGDTFVAGSHSYMVMFDKNSGAIDIYKIAGDIKRTHRVGTYYEFSNSMSPNGYNTSTPPERYNHITSSTHPTAFAMWEFDAFSTAGDNPAILAIGYPDANAVVVFRFVVKRSLTEWNNYF